MRRYTECQPVRTHRSHGRWIALAAVILACAYSSRAIAAANIFDDNWSPPAPPLGPSQANSRPGANGPAASPGASAPAAQAARRPIPDKADQARSRKLLKELFASQLSDRSLVARRALAEQLLDQAGKAANLPADEFLLLAGAADAAGEASDFNLVCEAADRLAARYEVDGLRLKSDAALKMNFRGNSARLIADNCSAGLHVVEQLIRAEDYSSAARVLTRLRSAAGSDPTLSVQVQARTRELDALRIGSERIVSQLETLKAKPADPSANLAVGSFYCFMKGDWDRGLPLLTKGLDKTLAESASLDLARPSTAAEQKALGDRWWSEAERKPEPARSTIQRRASALYLRAVDGLVGPAQALVLKRLAECAAAERLDAGSPNRSVLFFQGNGREEAIFNSISGGNMRIVARSDSPDVLADPNAFLRPGIVVFGVNFLKDVSADALGDAMQRNIKRFVENGGDLIVFAQHAEDRTELLDSLFGVKVRVLTFTGAVPAVPELAAAMHAAGLTDATVQKRATFYESYTIPEDGIVFLRGGAVNVVSAAGIPFGKGRVIVIGNNVDPVETPITECVLNYVYRYKQTSRGVR